MIKIFVGGFPLETQELELVQLLSLHGEVVTIKIVRDKKTKICKGYAFVEVTDIKSAEQIIEALDGAEWHERPLSINIVPTEIAPTRKPFYIKTDRPNALLRPKRPRK